MSKGYNLGNAYVQIIPSFDGAKASLTRGLESAGADGGARYSQSFGSKLKSGLATVGVTAMAGLATATAAAGAGIVAFGKSAVSAGMNFDASMSQVAATMGTTVDQIGDLREFAMEMGSTTAFSATQAADALNYMALAGYDSETAMAMLPTVLNLAAAGGIELASASDMVTDAASALGLTTEETTVLVDKMAQTASKSNTSVAQLGDAILTVGGTAKNLAGGTTELSTALGILADNGIKGAEGGTALRNIILSLSAPTDKAAQLMGQLGLEVFDAEGNMRPLNETFGDLDAILSGMTQAEQTEVLSTLFNKVDLKSANALLANCGDRFTELSGAIDDCSGAAKAMADTQLDNLAGDVTLFKSALEGAQIAISDVLTPSLREFVQFGSDGLSRLTEAFKENGLGGAMGVLGEIISEGLTMVVGMLPQAVDAAVSLVEAFIEALVDSMPQIVQAAADIVGSLVQGIAEMAPLLIELAASLVISLAEALPTLLPTILDAIVTFFEGIGEVVPRIIPSLIEAAKNLVIAIAEFFPTMVTTLVPAAIELFMALVEALPEILPALVDAAVEAIFAVVDMLPTLIPTLLQAAIQLFMALVQAIPTVLGSLLGSIGELIGSVVGRIGGAVGEMLGAAGEWFGGLITGAGQKVSELIDWVAGIPGRILDTLGNLGGLLLDAGSNIIHGLLEGITGAFGGVMDFIGGIGDWIFSHKGPLSYDAALLVPAGKAIMGGLENSLEDSFGGVKDVIDETNDYLAHGIKASPSVAYSANVDMTSRAGAGVAAGGILITGNTFNVRDDHDIDLISEQLYRKISRAGAAL